MLAFRSVQTTSNSYCGCCCESWYIRATITTLILVTLGEHGLYSHSALCFSETSASSNESARCKNPEEPQQQFSICNCFSEIVEQRNSFLFLLRCRICILLQPAANTRQQVGCAPRSLCLNKNQIYSSVTYPVGCCREAIVTGIGGQDTWLGRCVLVLQHTHLVHSSRNAGRKAFHVDPVGSWRLERFKYDVVSLA